MPMKRPNLNAYFRARIDHHVFGMMSRMSATAPQNVKSVKGDVTDREIVVTMLDGTTYKWEGGRYAARKVNGCYAPLMPKPVK